MHTSILLRRQVARISSLAVIATLLLPYAHAQSETSTSLQYELRPHCEDYFEESTFGGPVPAFGGTLDPPTSKCATFAVADPLHVETSTMQVGDILDIDLVIHNPGKLPVQRFRAWVIYDPTLLEGQEVTVSEDFPSPTPGEVGFVADEGYIKLSGTSNEPVTDELIPVGRMRLKVLSVEKSTTPMAFYDVSGTPESKSGIYQTLPTGEENMLSQEPGSLIVRLGSASANTTSESSSESSAASSSEVSSAVSSMSSSEASSVASESSSSLHTAPTSAPSVFTMLQVQGLRVTTDGSSAFLAWDALPSTELTNYNVYYGKKSGEYIQRRTVDKSATSLTIRALPIGATYYFAVRGLNASNQETEFSQEAAVVIGSPWTSTSPLTGSVQTPTPGNNGAVAGSTGAPTVLLLLALVSAAIGTITAVRRQYAATQA